MIAAGIVAEAAIVDAIYTASQVQPSAYIKARMTPEQQRAYDQLIELLGTVTVVSPPAFEIARAAVDAMVEQAQALLSNPTVKTAHDRFQTVAALSATN
jgi:hypothetical protein